jgi:monovalent cation:proton antiporter-2 (CPA2) family protein
MSEHGFLVDAFIFLAAAVIVVPLAKRGGLGSVLGYLLAGIAIGPFGARFVSDPEDVLRFAEVGVVMMLFLIGLELQPSKLWRMRKPIVGLGGAQVVVTCLAITAAALALGQNWRTALTIGMALALSSTAIGLQILEEKKLLKSVAGESTFSVLLFQDVAIIPMLALLPLLGIRDAAMDTGVLAQTPDWVQASAVVGVVVAIILAGRYLLQPLFRFIASTGLREIFTAFSLFLVIGIALLMQAIGLSPALGTFLAGVVLAESSYRHELESNIEPFKGLLLGLFFISVGMSIDFELLGADPAGLLGLVAGLIVLKLAILALLGRAYGLALREVIVFGFLLAQGGEFAFVLFQFAVDQGAIAAELAQRLTAVVALSMAATLLLMIANDRLIQPRLARSAPGRAPDRIEPEDNSVIILGYGRFGQIVGRLLSASGVGLTVLDNDPDHIEALRRYGHKAFYGDGSRVDMLHAAGADRARLLILAIDDPAAKVRTVKLVRQHFPHLKILARARGRTHAFELMAAGTDVITRETFHSALHLGGEALILLGEDPAVARRQAAMFERHDTEMLMKGYEVFDDEVSLIALIRQSRAELEALFRADREGIDPAPAAKDDEG